MLIQNVQTILNRLKYDLDEIKLLTGRASWVYFEYKHYILSLGIAKLESIRATDQLQYRPEIDNMLSQYRQAYQTILHH